MAKLTLGKKINLGVTLGSLLAQLFLKGHNKEKAQVIGEQIGGVAEDIADTIHNSDD